MPVAYKGKSKGCGKEGSQQTGLRSSHRSVNVPVGETTVKQHFRRFTEISEKHAPQNKTVILQHEKII